jgi:SPP1 family predicted phage head-tail adaptor
MQAGKLNSCVKLQQLTSGQDEIGQPVQTWSDVATVWADIRHLSGLEVVKADSPASVVKASIRIRYRTGINAGMRVLHGATAYNITAVLPDEAKKQYTDLACEVVNG